MQLSRSLPAAFGMQSCSSPVRVPRSDVASQLRFFRATRGRPCLAQPPKTIETTTSVVRLELNGIDAMEALKSVSDIMCEEAFESNSWDIDEPSDEMTLQGTFERRMYKARFVAGTFRKIAVRGRNEFEQILVIDGSQGDAWDQRGGTPGSIDDASQLPADSILGYADVSVEKLDGYTTETLSIPEDSLGCVLRNFIVRPDVRRQGLGTELARGCIETARGIMAENSGVAACVLQVYRHNYGAIALYDAAGFCVVEEWEDQEWIAGVDSGALGPPKKLLMAATSLQ